jgi:hypothetical protein
MNYPLVSVILVIAGALIGVVGTILLLVAAFRQSLIWGLVTLLLPLGNVIFTCAYWSEARVGFLASIFGTAICFGGLFTIPEVQTHLLQLKNSVVPAPAPAATPAPDLNAQILAHRQHLDALQAAFAQDGAELTKQYQALDAQRKALKPKDTAAIAKFNEVAAAYQARTTHRKQMKLEIEAAQKELNALTESKTHPNGTPPPSTPKA